MPEKTAEEYARELMQMYNSVRNNAGVLPQTPPAESVTEGEISDEERFEDSVGGLQVNVTTMRRLLPVSGAQIAVFTGETNGRTVIETDVTDESGKTGVFRLRTPAKAFSESAAPTEVPYALYNVEIKADGYVDQIYMNVPVFSGVVSVQGADLISIPAAGSNTSPIIIDTIPDYNL